MAGHAPAPTPAAEKTPAPAAITGALGSLPGGGETKTVWNYNGASYLDELQTELRSTVMVRRLKKDVLKDLPDKTVLADYQRASFWARDKGIFIEFDSTIEDQEDQGAEIPGSRFREALERYNITLNPKALTLD